VSDVKLSQLDTTAQVVFMFFRHEPWKAVLWFTTPNPNLGGATPMSLIKMGREHKVIEFVKTAMWLNEEGPA